MSDTPRTDAAVKEAGRMAGLTITTGREQHYIDFARQLERELKAVHDAVLEAAAVEVESREMLYGAEAAKRIRALKHG
jgi:hypothetical protein